MNDVKLYFTERLGGGGVSPNRNPGCNIMGLYLRMWTPSLPKPLTTFVCLCLINLHDTTSPVSTQQYSMVQFGMWCYYEAAL